MSYEAITGSGLLDDSAVLKARDWVVISFVLAFGGLLGSGWNLFARYVVPDQSTGHLPSDKWPGIALFLQNILIFLR